MDFNSLLHPPPGYYINPSGIGFISIPPGYVAVSNGMRIVRANPTGDSSPPIDHRNIGLQPARPGSNPRITQVTSESGGDVILMYTNARGGTRTRQMSKRQCLDGLKAMEEWKCFLTDHHGSFKAVYDGRLLELQVGDHKDRYLKLKNFLLDL